MRRNKSSTYILPLVARNSDLVTNFISEDNYPTNLYHNSYLYHSIEEYKFPCLLLVYKFTPNPIYEIFENKFLLTNPNFIEKKDETKYLVSYLFKIPNDCLEDYDNFIKGKYSKIKQESKNKIIRFLNLIKYEKESKNNDIVNVLYKSSYLKEKLEKKIDYILPDDAELSSSIEIIDETFNLEEYLKGEENEQMA